jgi:hypothetical protein
MYGGNVAFFGFITVDLVRNGSTVKTNGAGGVVEMLLQICKDYHTLPDPRTLTTYEIKFFYSGGIADLQEATKPGN